MPSWKKVIVSGSDAVLNSLNVTTNVTASLLLVKGSGSVLLDVQGSQGQLFSITDSLSGSLFSVKDISGIPVIEAFSDNTVRMGQFGQKALFVSQSRVGIGKETALTANLDISGSAAITGSLAITGSTTIIGTSIVTGSFRVTGSLNVNNSLYVSASSVGINNPNPSQSLDVIGNIRITNPGGNGLLQFYNSTAANGGPALYAKIIGGREVNDASGYLGFIAIKNGVETEGMRLNRDGNLSIGKTTANTPLDILGNTTITGSLTVTGSSVFSGSVVSTLGFTGSLFGTASNAATASSADNFTVRGTLTAQTIVAQTVTSSIEFVTGSTRNGSLLTDTHQFTGSVGITGSLTTSGSVTITGGLGIGTINTTPGTIQGGTGIIAGTYPGINGFLSLNGQSSYNGTEGIIKNVTSQPMFISDYHGVALYSNGSLMARFGTQNAGVEYSYINQGNFLIGTSVNNGYRLQVQPGVSGSLFVSGSSSFTGSINVLGNITSTGTITAQTLLVQTITSSIEFVTGSTRNGSLLTNTHQFTGSVLVTGSLTVNNNLLVTGSVTAAGAIARSTYINPILVASANSDVLVGLDITPTFTNGAFTGVRNIGLKTNARLHIDTSTGALITFGGGNSNDCQMNTSGITSWNQNFTFGFTGGGIRATFFNSTGNLTLQNGGTFTDAGFRLDVSGSTRLNGAVTVASASIQSQNTSSLASGTQTISTNATASFTAAFYNYTIASGSNTRAGQFIATWNGGSIQYMDNSTVDIGSTLPVALTASLSGANVLLTSTLPSTGWTIKTLVNLI